MVRPSIYRYAFFCLLRGEGSVFRISKEVGMILLNESVGDTYLPPSFLCCKRLEANSYRKNNVLYESSVLCRLLCGLLYDRWFFLFITTWCHLLVSRSLILWLSSQFRLVLLQTQRHRSEMVYTICSIKMESSVCPVCLNDV